MLRPHALGWLMILALVLPALADEPTAEERKRRWDARAEEEQAWRENQAAREAGRKAEWADLSIAGVEALGHHGDPAECVDVVFVGDGFTAEEQGDFQQAVERMAANYDTPPFDTYAGRMNLHRVDLVSNDSGIALDDPEHDTPLGGTRVAFPGGNLLKCNVQKAAKVAQAAVPGVDFVQVVLNTHGKFLASANSGAIVLLSTAGGHQRSIVVHEFAHNFAGLLDEYVDPKQAGGRTPPAQLARVANVSLIPNVHLTKWHLWNIPEDIFRGRERRKAVVPDDTVRCYEGAATFPDGVYRSEENCHMQRGRGKAFCRVCRERIELALFRFFPPITRVSPASADVVLDAGKSLTFSVEPALVGGEDDPDRVRWYLDGRRLTARRRPIAGPEAKLSSKGLEPGEHHLTAIVDLASPRVRIDRGRLSGAFTWTVRSVPAGAPFGLPERVFADVGTPYSLAVPEGWTPRGLPPGVEFTAETRLLSLTPEPRHQGAWLLRFAAAEPGSREESVLLTVRSPTKKRNRATCLLFLPDQEVLEGETLEFTLEAWDPDGDHTAWIAGDLPPGARFDGNTGQFTWDVGHVQRGSYEVEFEATDGVKRVAKSVRIDVGGGALFRGIFRIDPQGLPAYERPEERMLVALHHAFPTVRRKAAAVADGVPRSQRLAEALRLFRETVPEISAAAADVLDEIFEESASGGRTDHLDMFLDELPGKIWQFVDRPEDRRRIRSWLETALAPEGLARDRRKVLMALVNDLDRIEQYDRDRREWAPPAPITDKKYR